MSSTICYCGTAPLNTGLPNNKSKVINQAVLLVLAYLKADDGTFNEIAADAVIDQAYIDARTNHADPSKRWYPFNFSTIQDVATERAESATQSFDNGNSAVTIQGVRTFSGMFAKAGADVQKIIDSFKCKNVGFYAIDKCETPVGIVSKIGTLRPTPVFEGSLDTIMVQGGSSTTVGGVMVSFQVDQIVKDSQLGYVADSAITGDLLGMTGLIQAEAVAVTNVTTTGFKLDLRTLSGPFDNKIGVEGMVLADFVAYNVTDAATVTITSVTEAPANVYTFVVPAQTAADVLEITSASGMLTKGYEMLTATVTIP